jgi:hypothetical protein
VTNQEVHSISHQDSQPFSLDVLANIEGLTPDAADVYTELFSIGGLAPNELSQERADTLLVQIGQFAVENNMQQNGLLEFAYVVQYLLENNDPTELELKPCETVNRVGEQEHYDEIIDLMLLEVALFETIGANDIDSKPIAHTVREVAQRFQFLQWFRESMSSLAESANHMVHTPEKLTLKPIQIDPVEAVAEQADTGPQPQFGIAWMDAANGLMLWNNNTDSPAAIISFKYKPQDNELLVTQIQGTGKEDPARKRTGTTEAIRKNWDLQGFDWRPALISAAQVVASAYGDCTVAIQSAANNTFNDKYHEEVVPIFLKTYDETAQRLGYQLGDDGNWHQP